MWKMNLSFFFLNYLSGGRDEKWIVHRLREYIWENNQVQYFKDNSNATPSKLLKYSRMRGFTVEKVKVCFNYTFLSLKKMLVKLEYCHYGKMGTLVTQHSAMKDPLTDVLLSARVLLIDLSSPLDEDVCQGIVSSVEKSLSLVCSLTGPSRLSFFGLYALGTYPEVSFSLFSVLTMLLR